MTHSIPASLRLAGSERSTSRDPGTGRPETDRENPNSADLAGVRSELCDFMRSVSEQMATIVRGKPEVVRQSLVALLSGGSVLLEDVPGVGKTTLAKGLANLLGLQFGRIQCTPDLLPSDILGTPVYRPDTGAFEFRPGPIFCNLLVADEINRASPRTQSALLEAMQEGQVTIDSRSYALPPPFFVIATQNPLGFEGTFPLPEAQLDRFLIRLSMDYPAADFETQMLLDPSPPSEVESSAMVGSDGNSLPSMDHDAARRRWLRFREVVDSTFVSPEIAQFIVDIAVATRRDPQVRIGVSPRGSKMLLAAARALATLDGRHHVRPDDVVAMAVPVLAHRVALQSRGSTAEEAAAVVERCLQQVTVPV